MAQAMANKSKKEYEFTALHKYADVSPRKLRPFATMIRGRVADEALELLRFLPNKSARLLEAVLKSALGNAEDRGTRNCDWILRRYAPQNDPGFAVYFYLLHNFGAELFLTVAGFGSKLPFGWWRCCRLIHS